jgi:hypothetical protein
MIYGLCNHSAWLGMAAPCALERAFDSGLVNVGCGFMWSHPLKTSRLGIMCPACLEKKAKLESTVVKIKERLQSLNENMARRTAKKSRLSSTSMAEAGSETSESESSKTGSEEEREREGTPESSNPSDPGVEISKTEPDSGESSASEEPAEPPADVSFKRNEFYTGGTSLSSTTLITQSGIILF